MMKSSNQINFKNLILLNFLVLAVTLPFINQAIHIDDTAFVYMARQIQKDPLRPYSFDFEWGSESGKATHLLDTPLVSYYISFLTAVFGEKEIFLHSFFIVFLLICANAFYFLSKRFLKNPVYPALLMISAPTIMVMSHTLMLDVPALAFLLLSVLFFLRGIDKNSNKFLILGSLFAGIAYMAKPTSVVAVPLLALYALLNKKFRKLFYLLIPLFIVLLWSLHNYFFEDSIMLLQYLPWIKNIKFSSGKLAAYMFSSLSYIGGATLFFVFLAYPFVRKKKNFFLYSLALLLSVLASATLYLKSSSFASGRYSFSELIMFALFVSSSLFFIAFAVKEAFLMFSKIRNSEDISRFKDDAFLFLWLIGILVFNTFIVGGSVRYNALLLPPFILLYFRLLDKTALKEKAIKRISLAIVALTIISGILVSYADYQYADAYRSFSNNIKGKYGNTQVWYLGHWGFQYYNDKNNFSVLGIGSNEPKKRDIIIKALIPSPRKIGEDLKSRIRLIDAVQYNSKFPIRVQNPEAHAGFYTYGGGFLPYSISTAPLETFEVYEVVK